MLRKYFTSASLILLGLLGIWFGFQSHEPSDSRHWLGLILTLVAAIGLIIIFRRDLRSTEQEKILQWERIKSEGKLYYLLSQGLLGVIPTLGLILYCLFEVYGRGKPWDSQTPSLTTFTGLAIISVIINVVWASIYWSLQEKKYSNVR